MTLDLGPGEYRIVPSEETRNWDQRAGELLSGDGFSEAFEDADGFHEFTIEDATGRAVVELVRKRTDLDEGEEGLVDDLLGGLISSVKDVYLFRPPGDDPVFTLDIPRGFAFDYALTDTETGETLATWEKSAWAFGNWHLETPRDGHVATVKGSRWLRELNPTRRQGTYVVHGVDGSELGEFRRVGFDGADLSDRVLSQLEIRLPASTVPTEVGLAFAFGMFREARKGNHSHT